MLWLFEVRLGWFEARHGSFEARAVARASKTMEGFKSSKEDLKYNHNIQQNHVITIITSFIMVFMYNSMMIWQSPLARTDWQQNTMIIIIFMNECSYSNAYIRTRTCKDHHQNNISRMLELPESQ